MFKKFCVYYLGSIIKKYLISLKKFSPYIEKSKPCKKPQTGFEKYFNNEAEQII